jgi:hypothetical protein
MTTLPSMFARRSGTLLAFLFGLCLAGCSTIATFDKVAYDKATGAKAEALTLMDKATDSYSSRARRRRRSS